MHPAPARARPGIGQGRGRGGPRPRRRDGPAVALCPEEEQNGTNILLITDMLQQLICYDN